MARNEQHYDIVYDFAISKGLDPSVAADIAVSLSVLIPMRCVLDVSSSEHEAIDNKVVSANIKMLHGKDECPRVWPPGLGLPTIRLSSIDDLPKQTTYGQKYFIRDTNQLLETVKNGNTIPIARSIIITIGDPPSSWTNGQLEDLRAKAKERGLDIIVTNKTSSHPDNVAGLLKLQDMFSESMNTDHDEFVGELVEQRFNWSQPTNKLTIRKRPITRITRMRNNRRRG